MSEKDRRWSPSGREPQTIAHLENLLKNSPRSALERPRREAVQCGVRKFSFLMKPPKLQSDRHLTTEIETAPTLTTADGNIWTEET